MQGKVKDYIKVTGGVAVVNTPIANRVDWDLVNDYLSGAKAIPSCD